MSEQSNEQEKPPAEEITDAARTHNTAVCLALIAGFLFAFALLGVYEFKETGDYKNLLYVAMFAFAAYRMVRTAFRMK